MARDLALLVNPVAGRGAGPRLRAQLCDRLRAGGFSVRELVGRDAQESADLAAQAVAGGVGSLVVVGGDGMVHLAAQAAASADVTVGIVPTGTGNDLARALRIPAKDPLAAADVVLASRTRRVDLGQAAGRYFATVLASGFDSAVAERASQMRRPAGQLRYSLATLAELRAFEPIRYRLELDGVPHELDAMLVAVGNSASYGGGLRMCEGAVIDDGRLDVAVIEPVSKMELVKVYPRLFSGTHVRHPRYQRHRVTTVSLAAADTIAYADGERLGALPLTVSVAPGALRVYAPSAVPESS